VLPRLFKVSGWGAVVLRLLGLRLSGSAQGETKCCVCLDGEYGTDLMQPRPPQATYAPAAIYRHFAWYLSDPRNVLFLNPQSIRAYMVNKHHMEARRCWRWLLIYGKLGLWPITEPPRLSIHLYQCCCMYQCCVYQYLARRPRLELRNQQLYVLYSTKDKE
jgi:hypothetical protein